MDPRSLIGATDDPRLAATPESAVASLVDRRAVTIEASASLADAARLMRMEGISSVLVNGGSAIATERDISRGIGAGVDPQERVGGVATPHPMVVDGSLSVAQCAGIMLNEEVRHIVVAMPDGSTGVVSLREVAAVLLRHTELERFATTPVSAGRAYPENWLG